MLNLTEIQNRELKVSQKSVDIDKKLDTELIQSLIKIIEDKHGSSIEVYDSEKYNINFGLIITCTSRSSKNGSSIADHLSVFLKSLGFDSRIEGLNTGDWILVHHEDLLAINILTHEAQDKYNLVDLYRSRLKKS